MTIFDNVNFRLTLGVVIGCLVAVADGVAYLLLGHNVLGTEGDGLLLIGSLGTLGVHAAVKTQ